MKKIKLNDQGFVLPIIIIVMAVGMILVLSTLNLTSNQTKMTGRYVVQEKALQYAEAGYNSYLWHLNDNVSFYSTEDSAKMLDTDIQFEDGYYRLQVTRPDDLNRYVTITSTGWTSASPEIKRTIQVKIRKKQFVHHVYVSDNDGNNIWWTTGDEVHGPLHTNGDLRLQHKPEFYDTITYSGDKYDYIKNSNKKDSYKMGSPKQVDILEFPETNEDLKEWAKKESWAEEKWPNNDGLVFHGRTCIYLEGDKIRIRNQNEAEEDVKTISLQDIKNKVIYIDHVKGYVGSDNKWDLKTGNLFISGTLEGRLTIAARNNIYITHADPTNWEQPNYTAHTEGGIYYSNTTFGDPDHPSVKENGIYVRKAKGKDMLGLVANENIYILHWGWPRELNAYTENNDPHWEYYKKENYGRGRWKWVHADDVAPQNITIHAALFAVNGGFGYEDFRSGSKKNDIILWGSITQQQRLPVGLIGSTGYSKKYAHDPRMFYDYPPHILEPVNTGWEVMDWKEMN